MRRQQLANVHVLHPDGVAEERREVAVQRQVKRHLMAIRLQIDVKT